MIRKITRIGVIWQVILFSVKITIIQMNGMKLGKSWPDFLEENLNAILSFCSAVVSGYCDVLFYFMSIWCVMKLSRSTWHSPFKWCFGILTNIRVKCFWYFESYKLVHTMVNLKSAVMIRAKADSFVYRLGDSWPRSEPETSILQTCAMIVVY